MNHNAKGFFPSLTGVLVGFAIVGLFGVNLGTEANAQAQKERIRTASVRESTPQQPPYSDYKGVKIGMTVEQVRAKLGQPTREFEGQDLYVFTETETAQVYFDTSRRMTAISVDYLGDKSGAPDYRAIVGEHIQVKPDGSLYMLVRYEQLGFWVSFNRTPGDLGITTVTIQKIQ